MADSNTQQQDGNYHDAFTDFSQKAGSYVGTAFQNFLTGKNIGAPDPGPAAAMAQGLPLSQRVEPKKLPVSTPQDNAPMPSKETADKRAEDAAWALDGQTTKSPAELSRSIQEGTEDQSRAYTAIEDSQIRTQDILSRAHYDHSELLRAQTPINNMYFWEHKYAEKIVNTLLNGDLRMTADSFAPIRKEAPEAVGALLGTAQEIITFNNFAQKKAHDLDELSRKSSYLSWGWSYAKDLIPFRHAYGVSGTLKGAFLPGTSVVEQVYNLLQLPFAQRMKAFDDHVNELAANDIWQAREFVGYVLDHGQSAKYLGDALNLADLGARVAFPGFVTKGVLSLAKRGVLEGSAISAVRTVGRSIGNPGRPAEVVADLAAGNLKGGFIKDTQRLMFRKLTPGYIEPPESQLSRLHTVLDTRNTRPLYDSYGLLSEGTRRAYELTMANMAQFINRLKNATKLNDWRGILKDPRVVQGIYEEAVENGQYSGLNNRILDYANPIVDPGSNTAVLPTLVGRFDGTAFKSLQEAQNAIKHEGILASGKAIPVELPGKTKVKMQGLSAAVKQQGRGYVVVIHQPIRKDSKFVQMAIEAGRGNDKPDYILKKWASRFVGPEGTMSFADILERKMVTYMPNYLMQTLLDTVADVSKLGTGIFNRKQVMNDWMRVVKSTQSRINPANGKPGHWFENEGELRSHYQSILGRDPSDLEIGAYFGLKNASDMDWVARNARVYTEMHNAGLKKLMIRTLASGSSYTKDRKYTESPFFHGRAVPKLPGGDQAIGFFGPNIDDMDIVSGRKLGRRRKELEKLVQEGEAKCFEVHEWHNTPLSGYGLAKDKDMIRYVVAKGTSVKEFPIDAVQVPYTGAGHLIPKAKYYFKQAHMRPDRITGMWHYVGETTFGAVPKHAEGKAFEKHFDELQRLTREGKMDEMRQYHLDNELPWGADEWEAWTRGKKDQQGVFQQPFINLRDPIRVIPSDKSYIDSVHGNALKKAYGDKFNDINTSSDFQHRVPFTQARDMQELRELRNEGTVSNPLWKFEHAELLDPLQSLERGINAIIRSQWMDDHKVNTIKRWLDDGVSRNLFSVSPEEIQKAPFYWFHHPDDLFSKGVNPIDRNFMMTNHQKIKWFTGIGSRTESMTHNFMQSMVDRLYESGAKWASDKLIGIWDWATDHDPGRLLRSMVFHKSLGLFSVPIMFLHAATSANTMMITSPMHWARGMSAVWLHGMASFNQNPRFLNALDKVASGMGWRPGEWLHAYHMTSEVPFLQEPGTYALHEEALSSKLISTLWGKFLHAGLAPFNFGLKTMRSYAWYTAMSEFRHGGGGTFKFAGHLGGMSSDHVMQVLGRADLLAHNMTRASASYLNTGWRSTPLQFMTYHDRLINLAIGKQMTRAEKSRFFAGNLMLYGIGGPLSLYTFGMADLIKDWNQSAIANGYQPGKNGVQDFFMRGLPAIVLSYAAGDAGHQYWFNIADRFGPKGMAHQFIGHYARESNGPAWDLAEMLGGPLLSSTQDMLTAFNPFWRAVTSMFDGGSEDNPRWNITTSHVMAAFRRISSINNMYTAYYAARFGKWYTRDGGAPVETDIPTVAALFMAATGARSQEQVDMYAKQRIMEEDKKAGQSIMLEMRNLMERASEATEQGNIDEADTLWEDAFSLQKGLTDAENTQVQRMIRMDSQIKATDNSYYNLKRVTPDKQEQMLREKESRGY